MAYTPNVWESRNVQYPNRWTDQNGNLLTLTPSPGTVTSEGTPFNATWMNHIEEGIASAGSGAIVGFYPPSVSTSASVGQLYNATSCSSFFICTSVSETVYTWAPLYLYAGANIYVSSTGSDATGNGTHESPYATIQHAINLCPPQTSNGYSYIIRIEDGTYNENLTIRSINTQLIIHGIGSGAILSCSSGNAISVINSYGILLSNLTITTTYTGETTTSGVLANGSNVTVNGVTITGFSIAIYANYNSGVVCGDTTGSSVSSCTNFVNVGTGGTVTIVNASGTTTGTVYVATGGIIFIGSSSVTGYSNYSTTSGGRIYSGSQSSVPSY